MPQVVKAVPADKCEQQTKLGNVRPGEVFRFPHFSFEEALAGENGAGFYQVIDIQPKKTGRVTVVSVDGKSVLEKDDDRYVVVHPSKLEIGGATLVDVVVL